MDNKTHDTLRCSVCNRTNNIDVTSSPEEHINWRKLKFTKGANYDKGVNDIVCYECTESISNWNNEWELEE